MIRLLFTILLVLSTQAYAQDQLNWVTVEEAERIQLDNPDKPMFIDVYTDWCGWCKKMDKSTFKDEEVVSFLNEYFIPVKLDAEQKEDITFRNQTFKYIQSGNRGIHQLAAILLRGAMSYPSYLVLNSKGEITHHIKGYQSPNDLLNQL